MKHAFEIKIEEVKAQVEAINAQTPILVQPEVAGGPKYRTEYPEHCKTDADRKEQIQKRIVAIDASNELIKEIISLREALKRVYKDRPELSAGLHFHGESESYYNGRIDQEKYAISQDNITLYSLTQERADLVEMQKNNVTG